MERPRLSLSEAERQRAEEVDRFAALGAPGLPALLEMLEDPSWTVRRGVVASLAAAGPTAVASLCEVLRTRRDSETCLAAAVDALVASTGDPDDALVTLSVDDDPALVSDAAQILGRRRSARAIPRLAELVSHRDENVAVSAIEALGRVGGRAAVDSLVQTVRSGSFFRTFPAIDVLGRSGDPRAVAPLASLLHDPRYTLEAARALGRTGSRSAVAPLAGLLARPGDAVVRVAAVALAELRDGYQERYGMALPIDDALQRSIPIPAITRRLVGCLNGASQVEQVALCAVLGALGSDATVQALTGLLDGSPAVAAAAAAALAPLHWSPDMRVITALREGDSARKLLILPLVSDPAATEVVVACVSDSDPEVRAAACSALARIGDPGAVPCLFPLLADPYSHVIYAALAAIQALGGAEVEALALASARSAAPGVRRTALRILAYFGFASAGPVFFASFLDPDERVRDHAIQGLPFVDDPVAIETLLAVARAPDARARASATRALGRSSAEPRVVDRLLDALGDDDAWVRYYACRALGALAYDPAAERVANLLRDPAGHVRVAAVEALSGMRGEAALAALLGAAGEREADLKRAALIGLGLATRPESLPSLIAATDAPDAATRLVAVSALARFSDAEALSALTRAMSDTDESVSATAMSVIAGRPGVDATRALVALLHDDPRRARVCAALSVGVAGRVQGIVEALEVADDELAPHLASALARIHDESAAVALLAALDLLNPAARKAAATVLAALGTRDALAAIEDASSADPDPEVRSLCSLIVAQWAA